MCNNNKEESTNDKRLEYLKLLIDKHKEISKLYYTRYSLFVSLLTGIIGAMALTLVNGCSKLDAKILWGAIILESVFGLLISISGRCILIKSNIWIKFWESKIFQFELDELPKNKRHLFFADRLLKTPELIKKQHALGLDQCKIKDANRSFLMIYKKNRFGIHEAIIASIDTILVLFVFLIIILISFYNKNMNPLNISSLKFFIIYKN